MSTTKLEDLNINPSKDSKTNTEKEVKETIELLTRNLQEYIDSDDLLVTKIKAGEPINIYWGTATTGRPHIAYFLPMLKIKDFLESNACNVTILLADVHAMLDNLKSTEPQIKSRTIYYKKLITVLLTVLKVDINKIRFVEGSSFQTKPDFTMDLYRLSTLTTYRNSKKAGSEVVKQVSNVKMSSMLYPLMQALDEEYLKCDVQLGGVDQRKIFTYAREHLPKIGYKRRVHFMNPIIQGLKKGKMSSSEANSKIDFLDSREDVNMKIRKAFQDEGNSGTGLMELIKFILLPFSRILSINIEFNKVIYSDFNDIAKDVESKRLHPVDIKDGVSKALNEILDLVREGMEGTESIIEDAYSS